VDKEFQTAFCAHIYHTKPPEGKTEEDLKNSLEYYFDIEE
jgi:hypothetical protein